MPAVCQSEGILPQQLALLPVHVSVTAEESGCEDVTGGTGESV